MLNIAPFDLPAMLEKSHVESSKSPHVQLLRAEPYHFLESHEASQGEIEIIIRGGPQSNKLFKPFLVEKLKSYHHPSTLGHTLHNYMLYLLLTFME